MAQSKSKSKRPKASRRKHNENDILNAKFADPKSKNQKLWNEEIDRLLRFENKHNGVKIHLPKKPTRVTKHELSDLKELKGRKILEISSIEVAENDPLRDLQKGEMNAAEYYNKVIGDRPLNKGGSKYLNQHLQLERQRQQNQRVVTPENEEIELELAEQEQPFSPVTANEITEMEFTQQLSAFRPEFQELVGNWADELISEMGENEFYESLREYQNEVGTIGRKEAYSKKSLVEWERKFVERLPQGSVSRETGERLLQELEENRDVSDEYEAVQQHVYESRTKHRKPTIDYNERRRVLRERGYKD